MLNIFEGLTDSDAVIVSVLNDEQWYGDDWPHRIIGAKKSWRRTSQTAAQAKELRDKVVELFYRDESNQSPLVQLATRLEYCRPNHRCGSSSCPECQRAVQRWLVANIHEVAAALLRARVDDGPRLTGVPPAC